MLLHSSFLPRIGRLAPALLIALGALTLRAATITNVTIVNVSPSSFSLVWRGISDSPDEVQVYADPNGNTNITKQLGVELFPLHTGNPNFLEGYERRQSRADLRAKTKALGLVQAKIRNGKPGTTYYFKITEVTPTVTYTYPATGFASIQLPPENTFVLNSQQLIIDMPGMDHSGYIVTLTHTNATHALAAVVGDGVGTNQVFFNLNDIFAMTGGNLAPNTPQDFSVTIMGPPNSDEQQAFNVAFTDGFSVGGVTGNTTQNDFLIVNVDSGVFRVGDTNQLAIELNSTALSDFSMNIDLPNGRFDKLALKPARGQIDPASVSIVKGAGTTYTLSFHALTGNSILGQGPAVLLSFVPTNTTSAFIPIRPTSAAAHKSDGTVVTALLATSGRMVIVGDQPLLEATLDSTGRKLTLYAKPASSYEIQGNGALGGSQWDVVTRVAMTDLSYSVPNLNTNDRTVFYRALEFVSDQAALVLTSTGNGLSNLRIFGKPGTYNIVYTGNMSPPIQWNPLLTYTLSNSFGDIPGLQTTASNRFYRATK